MLSITKDKGAITVMMPMSDILRQHFVPVEHLFAYIDDFDVKGFVSEWVSSTRSSQRGRRCGTVEVITQVLCDAEGR